MRLMKKGPMREPIISGLKNSASDFVTPMATKSSSMYTAHTASSMFTLDPNSTFDSFSQTNYLHENVEKFYEISKWLNVILITLITLVGIYGNLVSIIIFFSKLNSKSNSMKSLKVYLITLALSDLGVLVFHYVDFTFRSWVNLTEFYKARFNFVDKYTFFCKSVPYVRNVFRTTSVYILIFMTLQRLIILYFPFNRAKWSSSKFNNSLVIGLSITALLLNVNSLLMNTLVEHTETAETFCSINKDNFELQFWIEIAFVGLTILLPIFIIMTLSVILYNKINPNKIKSYQMNAAKAATAAARNGSLNSNLLLQHHGSSAGVHFNQANETPSGKN
jgi:hypothetical protein